MEWYFQMTNKLLRSAESTSQMSEIAEGVDMYDYNVDCLKKIFAAKKRGLPQQQSGYVWRSPYVYYVYVCT